MRQETFDKLQGAIAVLRETFHNGVQVNDNGYPVYQINNKALNLIPVNCGVTKALGFHLKEMGYIKYLPGGMYRTTPKFAVSDAGITSDVLSHMRETQLKWQMKQAEKDAAVKKQKASNPPQLFPAPEVEIIPIDRKAAKMPDEVLIAALKARGYKIMKTVTELREV